MGQWINRTVLSGASADPNGTTSHTCSFTPANAGNVLVAVVTSATSCTTPTGWTLAETVASSGYLYVFIRTASAGDASFTTTHAAANYALLGVVYEFYAGTARISGQAASGQVQGTTQTGPLVGGLSGTYSRFAARSWTMGSGASSGVTAWTLPTVEDYDAAVYRATNDGTYLTIAYDDAASGTSFTPSSVLTTNASGSGNGVSFALAVTPPPSSSTHTNNAEAGTSGATVQSGEAGSGNPFNAVNVSGGATLAYNNQAAMHGNKSYRGTSTTGADMAFVEWNGDNDPSAALRFYICLNSVPSAAVQIANIRNSSSALVGINLNASQRLQLVDATSTSLGIFTNSLVPSTWYRVELSVTVGTSTTGSFNFAYYNGDALTPLETAFSSTTANLGTTNATTVRVGKATTTASATDFMLDDIAFTSGQASFLGPSADAINTISDTFDDNAINTRIWLSYANAGTAVAETGGRLVLTPGINTPNYCGYYSKGLYNLTGSNMSVECVQGVAATTGSEQLFSAQLDGNNLIAILFSGGSLVCRLQLSGSNNDTLVTRDDVAMRWWRIRESSGTIYWETSPDRQTWTTRRSASTPFAINALIVLLTAGTYVNNAAPGVGLFDNLNMPTGTSLGWFRA